MWAKLAWTIGLAAAGVFIGYLAGSTADLPALMPYWVVLLTLLFANFGVIWFYSYARSNGVFLVVSALIGFLLWAAATLAWPPLVSVLAAITAGVLLCIQPILGRYLDQRFARTDERRSSRPKSATPSEEAVSPDSATSPRAERYRYLLEPVDEAARAHLPADSDLLSPERVGAFVGAARADGTVRFATLALLDPHALDETPQQLHHSYQRRALREPQRHTNGAAAMESFLRIATALRETPAPPTHR